MPNVSGFVYYDPTFSSVPGIGIPNVPVALYNSSSGIGAVALTNATGAYTFSNVPTGNYRLIESWGTTGVATPVNFATAAPMAQPPEVEPPLSAVPAVPPPLADRLNALSPNLLSIGVTSADFVNQNFYDAPVGNKPITFYGIQLLGSNLITAADNGTWGTYPGGQVINSTLPSDPYPGVTPGFTYSTSSVPSDGFYTIMNTRGVSRFPWWPVSDHTTAIETGRYLLVNGSNPGSAVFTQTVPVTPNTHYALTAWILNLMNQNGFASPKLALQVLDSSGNPIFFQNVNPIAATTDQPVWYQNGFLFNTGANSSVTVRILSEGPAASGNDYLIDDVALYRANIINLLGVEKSFLPSRVSTTGGVGQDVTVTVVVTNTSTTMAPNVFFQDSINPQLQFVPGSVQVNGSGVGFGTADPNLGFTLGNMAPGEVKTVTFHVKTLVNTPVMIPNTANVTYDSATSGNGDVIKNTVPSNVATLDIGLYWANVTINKKADKTFADVGDVITYTFTLNNMGNLPANGVTITDAVPSGTTFIPGSVTGATGNLPTLTLLAPIPVGGNATVTFQVQVGNTVPVPNPISNSGSVAFTYTVDPSHPNGGSGTAQSNTTTTMVNSAIIQTVKKVDKAFANVGDLITYTIQISNSGNAAANHVILTDGLPSGVSFVPGSLLGATGTPPTLTLTSPIPAGGSATVTYQVLVGPVVPNPNPVENKVSVSFTYTVDPTQPNGKGGISYSETVKTQINTAKLVVTKIASESIGYIGDVITYHFTVTNTGNVPADSVVITDPIPNGTVLVPGSLLVSAPYTGDPNTAITLTNPVPPGGVVTIAFQVKVTAIPNPNPIVNVAKATYAYTVNPSNPDGVTSTASSNSATTMIFTNNYRQQISDLINSVALEEAAMAAIANAEGAKIQKMIAMPNVTPQQLLCLNQSVTQMTNAMSLLEAILIQKLNAVDCQIEGNPTC